MKLTAWQELAEVSVSHNPRILKRVALAFGERPEITQVAQAVLPPGEVANGHHHGDMLELFMVISGSGEMAVDGVVHLLSAGSVILIDTQEHHELRNTGLELLVVSYVGVRSHAALEK